LPKSDSLLSGKRCLVLDDEFLIALDIQQILERAGAMHVASVASATAAIEVLHREPNLTLRCSM
jgi:CheY-like chemotaxis protein